MAVAVPINYGTGAKPDYISFAPSMCGGYLHGKKEGIYMVRPNLMFCFSQYRSFLLYVL